MRQRATKPGVLSNPYQYVEAGQEFDRDERMSWAVPVLEEPVSELPDKKRKGKKSGDSDGDPLI